jgi:hypothetical protein
MRSATARSHKTAVGWRARSRPIRTDFVTVVAPTRRRPSGPLRVHASRTLVPSDIVVRRGIPVTTIARMVVDLTDVLTPYELANVIHEADFLNLFDLSATHDAIARAHGRQRLAVLHEALELNAAGSAGTKSAKEDAFLRLLPHTIPTPLVNTIHLGEELDFLLPAIRLNVEVDGHGHRRKRTKLDDTRRDAKLHAAGYTVLRFTTAQVEQRPQQVKATLAAAYRRLVRALGPPR